MPSLILLFFLLVSPVLSVAASDDSVFTLVANTGAKPGPTLLVIGGIDGDEPGGFHAAATLVTRYQIKTGQLWIVPDLNRDAILKRERGVMNLKFAHILKADPLYRPVQNIKKIINDEQVDLVINLHDGSGFYYPERISRQRNPLRWGQSLLIDQKHLAGVPFGDLFGLSSAIVTAINPKIRNENEYFHIKDMNTAALGPDISTYHSLTWYALRHNKPALSIESSKTHPVHVRTYYILLVLEALLEKTGVTFSRDFPLTPKGVAQVIKEDAQMSLAQGLILLDLNGLKSELPDFPLPASVSDSVTAANPLISLQSENGSYRIRYGNNRLALLHPRPVKIDSVIKAITLTVDGKEKQVLPGTMVSVSSQVRISSVPEMTLRVVGLKDQQQRPLEFTREDLNPRLAIDREGRVFRLELYRDEFFSGMILLDFRENGGAGAN